MTDWQKPGKPDSIDKNYFINRFGVDLALTPMQQKAYFTLPDYHRNMLENIIIQNPYDFRPEYIKNDLALLCGDEKITDEFFKDTDKLARRLWSDYLRTRQEITQCMELHQIGKFMFPLVFFHQFQASLEKRVQGLIEQGILPERGESGLMAVVCLPEFERVVHDDMEKVFHGMPDVWRGYLYGEKQPCTPQPQPQPQPQPKHTDTVDKIPVETSGKPHNKQYQDWNNQIIQLWKTRKYKNKMDVCRRIEADEGGKVSAKHINDVTQITAKELKKI